MRRYAYIFLHLLLGLASLQAAESVSPYQVKSAFIYNFIKFVEWPPRAFETPTSPYVIGVLGRDPFGPILDSTMRGKSVNGREIIVLRISDADIKKCHLLFISNSERRRLPQILNQIGNAPVLTIGETEEFAEAGGMVNFYLEENKVRFQINIEAARRSDLKIHSTLLNLAKIVRSSR